MRCDMNLIDLRSQKVTRTKEEMLKHLKSFRLEPRFSAGVWYFFPGPSRFHEAFIEKGSIQDILDKVAGLYDQGAVDSSLGLEAHYPNEINDDLIDKYKNLQKETGIKLITTIPNLFYEKTFEFGSLSNPDPRIRRKAIDRTIETLKINKELNTEFCVVWPGGDGYEYPAGTEFYLMWDNFEKGLAEAMDAVPGIRVALEPKPYEPRGNNIYRNTANGILMARNVEALLTSKENKKILSEGHALVGLNPEVGHVMMGHEELAYAFASILREGRLAHTHWNSQPLGNYDQDLNVGVLGLDQMYAALLVMRMYEYRCRFGIDIDPERIPVKKALVLNINALRAACDRVNGLDCDRLIEAMYNPEQNRGVVEDVMTRALALPSTRLIDLNKAD
jgi:xylose isomerase